MISSHYQVAQKWLENYVFDAVLVAVDMPEIADVISTFRAAGIKTPILSADALDTPLFFDSADNAQESNAYVASNFDDESTYPPYLSLAADYRAHSGKDPDWGARQGYDAVKVLAKAIEKAGSVRAYDIAAALRSGTWEEAAGPYTFDESGNIVGRRSVIKRAAPEDHMFKKVAE